MEKTDMEKCLAQIQKLRSQREELRKENASLRESTERQGATIEKQKRSLGDMDHEIQKAKRRRTERGEERNLQRQVNETAQELARVQGRLLDAEQELTKAELDAADVRDEFQQLFNDQGFKINHLSSELWSTKEDKKHLRQLLEHEQNQGPRSHRSAEWSVREDTEEPQVRKLLTKELVDYQLLQSLKLFELNNLKDWKRFYEKVRQAAERFPVEFTTRLLLNDYMTETIRQFLLEKCKAHDETHTVDTVMSMPVRDVLPLLDRVMGREEVITIETVQQQVQQNVKDHLVKHQGRGEEHLNDFFMALKELRNGHQKADFEQLDESRVIVQTIIDMVENTSAPVMKLIHETVLRAGVSYSLAEYQEAILTNAKFTRENAQRERAMDAARAQQGKGEANGKRKPQEQREDPSHAGKKHKPGTSKPTTGAGAPRPKSDQERVFCTNCGKGHPGDCNLREHPSRNKEAVPWRESKTGKQWNDLGFSSLPQYKKIVNNQVVPHGEKPVGKSQYGPSGATKKTKGEHLNALCVEAPDGSCEPSQMSGVTSTQSSQAELSHEQRSAARMDPDAGLSPWRNLISFEDGEVQGELVTSSSKSLPCELLLDTGSNPYDYVSCRVRDILLAEGATVTACERKVDCGGQEITTRQCVRFKVRVSNKTLNQTTELTVIAFVLDCPHDIILGRPTIKKNATLKSLMFQDLIAESDLPWIRELLDKANDPGEHDHTTENRATMDEKLAALQQRLEDLEQHRNQQTRLEHAVRAENEKLQARLDQEYPPPGPNASKRLRVRLDRKRASPTTRREIAKLYALDNANLTAAVNDDEATPPQSSREELLQHIEGSDEQKQELEALCAEFSDCFSTQLRMEAANLPPMELQVAEDWESKENRRPPRPQGPKKEQEVDAQTDKMAKANVIRLSTASAHSQVLLTPKPNGTWRFCVDYRRLNKATKGENWPIPNIQRMLRDIGQKKPKYFGVLDLTKGYYQAPLSESSKQYTAFITAKALWEWNRVPMGLMGAPSYFQRVMTTVVLAGIMYNSCEVYLDDIIVFGETWDEYMANLRKVLMRLRQYKVTANPEKTKLGLTQVEYVGHTIDSEGTTFDRRRLEEVIEFPKPKTKGELKSFLGLANYVRDNIAHAADYTVELNALLPNYTKKQQSHAVQWTESSDAAYLKMQEGMNSCQKLFWLDYSSDSPIHLYTDASDYGVGAHLVQIVNGEPRTIALMSRTLTKTQRGWMVPEKEAFAIVVAFRKFGYLIRDTKFTLHTDHENLVYIRDGGSSKVLNWKLEVQEMNFDTVHVPGKDNVVSDYMSRNPMAKPMAEEPDGTKVTDLDQMQLASNQFMALQAKQWQEEEETVGYLCAYNGVIPARAHKIIASVHNASVGHRGVVATMGRLQKAGHQWPYMRQMVVQFIHECDTCQKQDKRRMTYDVELFTTGGTNNLMTDRGVDFVGPLPADADGNVYICTIIDTFSRWVELYPCKADTALCAASALLQHYGRFGVPKGLRSDRGSEFTNSLIKEFHEKVGVKHTLSIANSHEENSAVELANAEVRRFMRDLLYDRRLCNDDWRENLPIIQRVQNTLVKSTTGVSPAYMLYAGAINMDQSLFLEADAKQKTDAVREEALKHSNPSWQSWMEQRQKAQKVAIELARKNTTEANQAHLSQDSGRRTEFPRKSWVLKRFPDSTFGTNGPNKLVMRWKGPYKVVDFKKATYTLLDPNNGKQLEPCNIHLLKEYKYDAARVDPATIRLKDTKDTYEVAEVVGRSGRWDRKNTLYFKVRWEGYSLDECTWEPWSVMRDNTFLHDYLRQQGQQKLIPAKFNL